MVKENVTAVATRYGNYKTRIRFYTKEGKLISSKEVERAVNKDGVTFQTRVK
ncbi:hypothetical protein HY604_02495 [Candidatus Peregrinibacteria bacterium]|nr:hypothetical protein [Candidatus Peregrinibacteria bacterium]